MCGPICCQAAYLRRCSAASKRRKLDRVKKSRVNSAKAAAMMRELEGYEREGTHLYLDERPSRAGEIVSACMLAEGSDYMRDFISDDREHITEIHFIRITGKQSI